MHGSVDPRRGEGRVSAVAVCGVAEELDDQDLRCRGDIDTDREIATIIALFAAIVCDSVGGGAEGIVN